jgi:murein DD-endopeptidase MepM/ murein hydrolase activator NlpD
MGRHGILSFLIFSVFSVFTLRESSLAAEITVLPQELFPGDAFVLKVNDTKVSRLSPFSFKGKKFYFSRCGERCFIAVGAVEMKTKPGIYPVKLKIGKRREHKDIVIKPISFPTLELTLPEDEVFLSTENLKRVKKEERKLKSVFWKVSRRFWKGDFILPLENEISSFFGTKRIFNEKRISLHRGLDIRGEEGEEVKASNRGRVMLAEELFFGGNTIILDHGQGIHTLYMHLSEMNVRSGEMVSKGDVVGFVGSSGRSSGHHLHFGIKIMNISINPLSLTELDL